MAVGRFRYRARDEELVIDGYVVPRDGGGNWFAPFEKVANGSLASLAMAFSDERANYPYSKRGAHGVVGMSPTVGSLHVTMAPDEEFDDEYSLAEPFEFGHLEGVGMVIDTVVGLHGTDLDEDEIGPLLLTPTIERLGRQFVEVAVEGSGTQAYAAVRTSLTRRGATVRDAYMVSEAIRMLVERVADGSLDAESGLDLVRAGRADLLVGMAESDWLEVKSEAHLVDTEAGRIELAQDIARFCNGDTGSLLVIGLTTKRRQGRDVITSIRPSPSRYDTGRFHRVVDQRIFPPIEGIMVENATVPTADGSEAYVMLFHVPAQPEELKPFLVHGAIVGDRVEGAFISIVRRRGEHSIPARPESIHSALAAGRAPLRHGRLP